jgi:hypothetical protein
MQYVHIQVQNILTLWSIFHNREWEEEKNRGQELMSL